MLELRLICAALWLLLWFAVRCHARGAARWWAITLCGLALAADLVRWHVTLWHWTQSVLREAGLYESRIFFKVGLAVVMAALAFLLAKQLRRTSSAAGQGALGLYFAAAWLVWLLAWTAFLDDVLPAVFHEPAVRYGLEMSWALVPALVILRPGGGEA